MSVVEDLVGRQVTFHKTVSECDVYQFAGISGDFARVHLDEEYCKNSPIGRRVAHGVLLMAYMSTCSTKVLEGVKHTALSLGYDRVRFTKPVHIGDTVKVSYEIKEADPVRSRTISEITITNQHNETVAVASHILKIL